MNKNINIVNVINITSLLIGLVIGTIADVGLFNLTLFLIAIITNMVIIEKTKMLCKIKRHERAVIKNV